MKNTERLLAECIELFIERRMREADVSDGSKVKFGSRKHMSDLKHRISELEGWRAKQKRGSENRANYSRLITKLKGELAAARRKTLKKGK